MKTNVTMDIDPASHGVDSYPMTGKSFPTNEDLVL